MKIPQTESADIRIFEESEWSILPLNVPVLLIEPPDISLKLSEPEEGQVLLGDITFLPNIGGRKIDALTHRTLLEESLIKHKEIWKTLAMK